MASFNAHERKFIVDLWAKVDVAQCGADALSR